MKWLEIVIQNPRGGTEVAAALLLDFGINGVEIIDSNENLLFLRNNPGMWDYIDEELTTPKDERAIKFYLPYDLHCDQLLIEIQDVVGTATTRLVEDDWSEAWKQHFKPFKVGKNIIIVPIWEQYNPRPQEIVFKTDPGHVFGTGQHQSTALCITALEKYMQKGAKLLDIGCGSGILAIIGVLLGAGYAAAIDTDPQAVKAALNNASLNNVPLTVFQGDLFANQKNLINGFDVVIANITADVIVQIIPAVKNLTNGLFIAGGIISDKQSEVLDALRRAGFQIIEIAAKDDWVVIVSKGSALNP